MPASRLRTTFTNEEKQKLAEESSVSLISRFRKSGASREGIDKVMDIREKKQIEMRKKAE